MSSPNNYFVAFKIKDELIAITWSPNRVKSWCLDIEEQINIEQFKD